VVSSGEVASYNSVSKQTIASPVKHLLEFEEAAALAASFFCNSIFRLLCISPHFVWDEVNFRRNRYKRRTGDARIVIYRACDFRVRFQTLREIRVLSRGSLLVARAAGATRVWFGLARNTATTFDIF
jgi:hypothetical protein